MKLQLLLSSDIIKIFTFIVVITTSTYGQQAGNMDLAYNPGTGANHEVKSVVCQSDGKIIIGGWFTEYDGVSRNNIARLNSDCSLDLSFNPGLGIQGASSGNVWAVAMQPDNKVLVGGIFYSYDENPTLPLVRINSDGSYDNSFFFPAGSINNVRSLAVQPNGKILVGGDFTFILDPPIPAIQRLNTDGSIDESFLLEAETGEGANKIFSIAIQSDGKILIGGKFNSIDGVERTNIARLNTDGTLDNSFNPEANIDVEVKSIAITEDGKILVGGYCNQIINPDCLHFVQLNEDGSLDPAFNTGTGPSSIVNSIAIQSNGKIIIGGGFHEYDGTVVKKLARLNSNGSLDNTFNHQTESITSINTLSLQPGGKIAVGGIFTEFDGISANRVARVYIGCDIPAPEGETTQVINEINGNPTTIEDILVIGETVTWYASPEDIENNNPLSPETLLVSGATYYATQTIFGCTSEEYLSVTVTITLDDELTDNKIEKIVFYPNPVIDVLSISAARFISTIKVFDLTGKLLLEHHVNAEDTMLNLEALEAGSYIVWVLIEDIEEVRLLIKN